MIKAIRPKFKLLSDDFIVKIIEEACCILEKEGVFVENEEVLNLFKEAGMEVTKSNKRVFIKRKLIEDSLSSTPSLIKLYDRSGHKQFIIGGDQVHFAPGSTAVTIFDHKTQEQKKALTEDLIRFTRLTDCLEYIHFQSTAIISGDVSGIISDCYRLFIGLQFSEKPIVTGTFRVEGFKPMRDMLIAIRGSKDALERKPLAIFDACPSPPLKWSNLTSQSLIDCARAGIPSELISMGMTGATSPVTIGGTLVQHVAENLSGLVICQLAKKGAPVIFGGSPSVFDMRKGTTRIGAIETMMIDSAYIQIAKYLNLPTHAYMGLSDTKSNDNQAGFESGIGIILSALSGINVISGPGMMDFESCQSIEKLVIDNEICGMAYRLIDGISQRDEPIAVDLFKDITQESQFLSVPHTRKWYRKELTFPKLIDRDTYDYWINSRKKSIADRAYEEVGRLIKENPSSSLDKNIRVELKKIMNRYAQDSEISSFK